MDSNSNYSTQIAKHKAFLYFFSRLDYLLSRSFLNLLSRLSDNIIDLLKSKTSIKKASLIRKIKYTISDEKINEIVSWAEVNGIKTSRGTVSKAYSNSILIDPKNKVISDLVKEGAKYISQDYGKSLWVNALLYDIYNIPQEYYRVDTYSNIWHQDSHDGYLVFKMFVLVEDVSDDDGPFIFLDRKSTIRYWRLARDRNSDPNNAINPLFGIAKSFTGKKGEIMLINTATCFHRDSVPIKDRKILCITYFPEWRPHDDCTKIIR
tara:strand:- start:40538 stop:41329 length:792 start_codon:yes stop_codon:yes gene_type:complete